MWPPPLFCYLGPVGGLRGAKTAVKRGTRNPLFKKRAPGDGVPGVQEGKGGGPYAPLLLKKTIVSEEWDPQGRIKAGGYGA